MFTGIIEEIGIIKKITRGHKSSKFIIKANKVLEDTIIGDSICTNGVCVTVTNIIDSAFEVDIMAETLRKSNLGILKVGNSVNLERALTLNKRLGGHIVSGHVDGTAKIISLEKEDNAIWVTLITQHSILKYIVHKGSIAIDGISLTIAYVDDKCFKVSVIPHTKKETTLLMKIPGETVNIECDVIGKYIEKFLQSTTKSKEISNSIDKNFLFDNGFI